MFVLLFPIEYYLYFNQSLGSQLPIAVSYFALTIALFTGVERSQETTMYKVNYYLIGKGENWQRDSVKSLREAFPCKLSRVLVNLRTLIKYIHGRHVKYLDRET
jgi:hypothetical protein